MVNKPLIRPYLLGGGSFGGGTLDSHDKRKVPSFWQGSVLIDKTTKQNDTSWSTNTSESKDDTILGGNFKYFLFSSLLLEDPHFDEHIFQLAWKNTNQNFIAFFVEFHTLLDLGVEICPMTLHGGMFREPSKIHKKSSSSPETDQTPIPYAMAAMVINPHQLNRRGLYSFNRIIMNYYIPYWRIC